MNSKERVNATIKGQIPDKIPFGEFSIDFDTAGKILGHETYLRAKAKSQIAFWEGRRDEVVQSWKEDTVELYRKLDCIDLINVASMASSLAPPKDYDPDPPRRIDAKTWIDQKGCVYKFSETTADITMVEDPEMWTREFNEEDFSIDVIAKPDESIFEVVDYVIEKLGKDRFILGPAGDEVAMLLLGGMERGLTEFLTDPEILKLAYRKALAEADQQDQYYIRPGSDGVLWGQDFSYKAGPMISPKIFREFCLPAIKERVEHVKRYHQSVFKHACGNNWALMDMFLEAGYDCYQSIQPTARMDLKEVKERYGGRICLWGGIPVEDLVSGTPADIRKDVRNAVTYGAPRGGYIFGSSHSIAVGTKYDNFMAMLDEFEKLRNCY
jgi:hypothetical protein